MTPCISVSSRNLHTLYRESSHFYSAYTKRFSLLAWTVVWLKIATINVVISPKLGFPWSSVPDILTISYDFCLLPVKLCYQIIHVWDFQHRMQITTTLPSNFDNSTENLVWQLMQIQILSWSRRRLLLAEWGFFRVSFMMGRRGLNFNMEQTVISIQKALAAIMYLWLAAGLNEKCI